MEIIWDADKDEVLQSTRGISFTEIAEWILDGEHLGVLEHRTRKNQMIFVMWIREYTWAVPFVISEKDEIVLKTAFPDRKLHKLYGGGDE